MADIVRNRSRWGVVLLGIAFGYLFMQSTASATEFRGLPVKTYVDRMTAGWLGQMAGVGWGAPTEFRWNGRIIPADQVPAWKPGMINQFRQDDIYVEMTFLRTLEVYGFDVSIRQAGIDFANSGYQLWHANKAGRDNLGAGIAPPDSGHPKFNVHADDIDYQIEADFAGLIAPGLPNLAIELGEKFGRLMNYGDGLYGGQFIAGMYAAAFFETDPEAIVQAGLRCIPEGSQYAETIRDVLQWYRAEPNHWENTWQKLEAKCNLNPAYRRFSCGKGALNIDAKLNGRLRRHGASLWQEGSGPDDPYRVPLRPGFRLQPVQCGRRAVYHARHVEAPRKVHLGPRSRQRLQPYRVQLRSPGQRLRDARSQGRGPLGRTHRAGCRRDRGLRDPGRRAPAEQAGDLLGARSSGQ